MKSRIFVRRSFFHKTAPTDHATHQNAESGGDLVQHSGASRDPSGQFCVEERPAHEDPGLHRLLQQSVGQTLPVDVYRPGAENLTTSNTFSRLRSWARSPPCGYSITSVMY